MRGSRPHPGGGSVQAVPWRMARKRSGNSGGDFDMSGVVRITYKGVGRSRRWPARGPGHPWTWVRRVPYQAVRRGGRVPARRSMCAVTATPTEEFQQGGRGAGDGRDRLPVLRLPTPVGAHGLERGLDLPASQESGHVRVGLALRVDAEQDRGVEWTAPSFNTRRAGTINLFSRTPCMLTFLDAKRAILVVFCLVWLAGWLAWPTHVLNAQNAPNTYIVRTGDSLASIAARFGVSVDALLERNSLGTTVIYVGQVLQIPGTAAPVATPPTPNVTQPVRSGPTYEVKGGDTLFAIALAHGVSVDALQTANGISDPSKLWPGQLLKIPVTSSAPESPGMVTEAFTVKFFNNLNLTGAPAYSRTEPPGTRHDWGSGSPGPGVQSDTFSALLEGHFTFEESEYRFVVTVDDGMRLFVDNTLVLEAWHDQPATTYEVDLPMEAGSHNVRLEYYERSHLATLWIRWYPAPRPLEDAIPVILAPQPVTTPPPRNRRHVFIRDRPPWEVSTGVLATDTIRSTAISAGPNFCAVRENGSIRCWGTNRYGLMEVPIGSFQDVAVGRYHICGLRTDGTVGCWGKNEGAEDAPAGPFHSVVVGEYHSCGLRPDGKVICWGSNRSGQAGAPSGQFQDIAAGKRFSCGVRTNGSLACWGSREYWTRPLPEGAFRSITGAPFHACGVRTDDTVQCWGHILGEERPPPGSRFRTVSTYDDHSCGVRTDGTVQCWGKNDQGQLDAPLGQFSALAVDRVKSCGIRLDGYIRCWGLGHFEESIPPAGQFRQVSVGGGHICGLTTDNAIVCWGRYVEGQANAPYGAFRSVTTGSGHSCGLAYDGSVDCWGANEFGQSDAPASKFSVVDAGRDFNCGVVTDGSLRCWGLGNLGQLDAPAGKFRTVSTGFRHACALDLNDAVHCWPATSDARHDPPTGKFQAIDAGGGHSCGITAAGTVRCWGSNRSGQTTAPAGRFLAVSTGSVHTCGVRLDGKIECWGDPDGFEGTIPAGVFATISAGPNDNCAVGSNGNLSCWGKRTLYN